MAFTFAAVDDPDAIADAIGDLFDDAVLTVSHPGDVEPTPGNDCRRRLRDVDYRLLAGSGWSIVDESTVPITMFGAGGGVEAPPRW